MLDKLTLLIWKNIKSMQKKYLILLHLWWKISGARWKRRYFRGQPSGNRNVIIEFDDKSKALSFYNSEEYQKIIKFRTDNSDGYITIVDGLA